MSFSYLLPGGCCFSCFSCFRVTRVVCDSCLSAMTQDCLQVAGGPPVCSGRGRSNAGAAAPPCAAAAGVHTAMPAPFSLSRKCNRGSLCAPNLQFWVNGFLHLSQVSEFLLGFSGQSFHMQPLLGPVLRCKLTGQCHSGRAERTDCGRAGAAGVPGRGPGAGRQGAASGEAAQAAAGHHGRLHRSCTAAYPHTWSVSNPTLHSVMTG